MLTKTQRISLEIIILFVLTVIVIGICDYRAGYFQKSLLDKPKTLIIKKGMGLKQIADLLFEGKVIVSKRRFLSLAKLHNSAQKLKAGRYKFYPEETLFDVLTKIENGDTYEENITFPEGLTRFQIAGIAAHKAQMDSLKFVSLSNNSGLANELNVEGANLEGFLFPETYKISLGMSEKALIKEMVDNFWKVFADSLKIRAEELGMSIREVVTLASIIENEAKLDEERPIISAVFHNRLKRGQKLESCATVSYALGKHKSRLLTKDLKVKSPYNTYLYAGLPPGPICNPGKASIYAALYPADADYYYFVAKGDGSHIFSKTGRQHINAKNAQKRKANSSIKH